MVLGDDVFRLRSLLALGYFHRNLLAFLQGPESFRNDRGVVNENVLTILALDESESLIVVEPLDGSRNSFF